MLIFLYSDALLRTKGVGDVFSRADDFSMRIWLKPDKLAALGMTAADVTNALQEQNAQVAAGYGWRPRRRKTGSLLSIPYWYRADYLNLLNLQTLL